MHQVWQYVSRLPAITALVCARNVFRDVLDTIERNRPSFPEPLIDLQRPPLLALTSLIRIWILSACRMTSASTVISSMLGRASSQQRRPKLPAAEAEKFVAAS